MNYSKYNTIYFSIIAITILLKIYKDYLIVDSQYTYPLFHSKLTSFYTTDNPFLSKNSVFVVNLLNSSGLVKTWNKEMYIYYDMALLFKLLENLFIKKYNKTISEISEKKQRINISDYIVKGLYLYGSAYDKIDRPCKIFRQKKYWYFCEIMQKLCINYEKVIKITILRHLSFNPNEDNLLYFLIQYYYQNRHYHRCKTLINKILTKEKLSFENVETTNILIMMLINIQLHEGNIAEALELSILNLEKIKNYTIASNLLPRGYYILGVCYSKMCETMISYEEKLKCSFTALSCFKEAISV